METVMKKSVFVAGIAALALAGTAAWAADSNVHEMTIQLPGGGIEQIQYTGNVAPKVRVVPMAAMPQVAFMPMAFPDMARIQASMNAQMHAMMLRANALAAQSFANGPLSISAGGPAAGSHFCARSIQITTGANGKQNVVTHTAGDCGGGARTSAPANHAAPAKGTPI
jgi:hypothetical protein